VIHIWLTFGYDLSSLFFHKEILLANPNLLVGHSHILFCVFWYFLLLMVLVLGTELRTLLGKHFAM
jgi:hypothetical protein